MRRWILAAILILAAGTGQPASSAAADKAPSWVLDASRIPTPADVGDAPAVDLWREVSIAMKSNGRMMTVSRRVVRILTLEGRADASESEYYVSGAATVDLKAWAIRPSGTIKTYGRKETVDESLVDFEVYSEDRMRRLDLENEAEVGTVFGFESTVEEETALLQVAPYFQSDLPAVTSVVRIAVPPRWDVRASVLRHAPVEPSRVDDGTRSWTLTGLPHTRMEPLGPNWWTLVPRLAVNFLPPEDALPELGRVKAWSDVSRWLYKIAEPQSVLTDRLTEKARTLTAGTDDAWERIRRISEFVQSVRYAAVETGLARGDGFQPHAASEVLARSYGDCKDKANLEVTLLKAMGIRSYLVLIYHGDREHVHRDWATATQFNHCILAIAVSDGMRSSLVVDVPGLGPLLPFDPTDSDTPVGDLPLLEQGSLALIAAGSDGALVTMPLLPADTNTVRRQGVGKLGRDGRLEVDITLVATGQSATAYRRKHRHEDPAQYRSAMESWLVEMLPGASLTHFAVRDTTVPNEFRLEAGLVVPHAARMLSGGMLAFQPSFLPSLVPWFTEERPRRTPVRMDPARVVDTMEYSIPAGYGFQSVPDTLDTITPYGTLRTQFQEVDATLRYTQEITLNGGVVSTEESGRLKGFLAQARGAGRGYVVAAPR
jgi:hypothetical protein